MGNKAAARRELHWRREQIKGIPGAQDDPPSPFRRKPSSCTTQQSWQVLQGVARSTRRSPRKAGFGSNIRAPRGDKAASRFVR